MVNILTGTPFDAPKRLNHREDEGALEFPSSVGSRARGLLALKACNWRAVRGCGWTNPYITDGLVSMYDGIWNRDVGVHDSSIIVWQDLLSQSGVGLPIKTGRTVHDSYVELASGSENAVFYVPPSGEIDNYTIELVILPYFKSQTSDNTHLSTKTIAGVYACARKGLYSRPARYDFANGNHGNAILTTESATNFAIQHRSSDDYMVWFKNGVQFSELKNIVYGNDADGKIRSLGFWQMGSGNNPRTEVYAVRVYNRLLTAAEIAANYAVDKVRFGLT